MGLDVYLYHYGIEPAEAKRLQDEYEQKLEANWEAAGDYDSLSEEQKKEIWEKDKVLAKSLGLDEDGCHPLVREVELPSTKYPGHYFKVGYFRSSYNSGGINHILGNLGLPDLYAIFQVGRDHYVIPVDWNAVRPRLVDAMDRFRATPPYRAFFVGPNMFGQEYIQNEEEAIKVFLEAMKKHQKPHPVEDDFTADGWSSNEGHFYPKGFTVEGLIIGKQTIFKAGESGIYVVYKSNDTEWYQHAFEIMIETVDYVLAQPDPERYLLHWSA